MVIPGLLSVNREDSLAQEEVDWCNAMNNFTPNKISDEMDQVTEKDERLSWAAYHSKNLLGVEKEVC